MSDGRINRWVNASHLRLDLRSSVAVAADAPASVKARAIAAIQSGGGRGAAVQRLMGPPFAWLPVRLAAALPRVSLTRGAGLAIDDGVARAVLDRADQLLGGRVADVIWLIPPPSDGPRVSALLCNDDHAIGHLRVTDLTPGPRPSPATRIGSRTGIEWPQTIEVWDHDGIVVELTDAIELGRSEPTDLEPDELDALLADLRDSMGEAPDGLVAAHGDLTPWNLRTTPKGRRVLFDWEHRTYAPAGYDLVRFLLASGDGPARFTALPASRRAEAAPAIDALIALADERDATRREDELTEWKIADIAAERAALEAMRQAAP
jgi:hypothetical protein